MRTLLFVQTGNGKPRCIRAPKALCASDAQSIGYLFGLQPAHLSTPWMVAIAAANRWWLVECENAEEGGAVIGYEAAGGASAGCSHAVFFSGRLKREVVGRVVANGGAK